jgi:hydroxymethylpyrimidine/phosphomethylpyrimidine kinase
VASPGATTKTLKKVLSIAGSDCSGGAGIQADIKTISAQGMYAMSVLTALTAQNTTGVFAVQEVEPAFVAQQIDAVFSDIRPDAVKIGMVSNAAIIAAIAERLRYWRAERIVLDPVMIATSGGKLLNDNAVFALVELLFPLASVVTPNLPEAEVLCGHPIINDAAREQAAREIAGLTAGAVLIKGGHGALGDGIAGGAAEAAAAGIAASATAAAAGTPAAPAASDTPPAASDTTAASGEARDLLHNEGTLLWLSAPRVATKNTHGTGCTLSSAIACGLAAEQPLEQAVRQAKRYVGAALSSGLALGRGNGPLNHLVWQSGRSLSGGI